MYARELGRTINDDDADDDYEGEFGDGEETRKTEGNDGEGDVAMADTAQQQQQQRQPDSNRRRRRTIKPEWKIEVPLGSEAEAQRWRNGDMADVYDDALRTLLRLQGEVDDESDSGAAGDGGSDGNALATTLGKAERAGRAAEVVEKM